MKKFAICLTLMIHAGFLWAQHADIHASFRHIADNREYFSDYGHHQTILGARLNTLAGFHYDTVHSVQLGLNYLYEYGYRPDAYPPTLNLFYRYRQKPFELYFGSFPRKGLLNYPLVLLTDTLSYYRPNLEGGLARISWKHGFQTLWIDWTSRKTRNSRETFLTGFSGSMMMNGFYLDNYFYMLHQAGYAIDRPGDNIRDNGGGAAFLGYDMSKHLSRAAIRMDAGYVVTYDRIRPGDFSYYHGFMTRLKSRYQRIGLDAVYYQGGKPLLLYGDPLYSSGHYIRIDPYIIPFARDYIESKIALGIHVIDGEINLSQQILFTVDFFKKQYNL